METWFFDDVICRPSGEVLQKSSLALTGVPHKDLHKPSLDSVYISVFPEVGEPERREDVRGRAFVLNVITDKI